MLTEVPIDRPVDNMILVHSEPLDRLCRLGYIESGCDQEEVVR